MNLPEFSVKKPVAATVLYLGIIVLSIVALLKLPLDMLPDITYPVLTITTRYQGAGPQDVEEKVTKIIESQVGIVPNLKEIDSTSVENYSIVQLRFDWGTNLDGAANDVRDRLDFAKRFLPDGIDRPTLLKFDTSMMPVMFMTGSARQNYGRLNQLLKDEVAEPLKRIEGIGNVTVVGGLDRQIRVDVNKNRLSAYGIGLTQVVQALAAHNLMVPAGDINIGKQSFFLRLPAEFKDPTEIARTLIGNFQGRAVYLGDIAEVKDDFAEPLMIARKENENSAMMIIQKRSGANTVKVANAVKKMLPSLIRRLPSDVDLKVVYDSSDNIKKSLSSLSDSVLLGGLFVVLVTYLFLFRLRSSLVIIITIPISLIVSFLFLYLMGYTINIMSLSSIAIAIGMVVDNAIVVLENIVRHQQELNEDEKTAAISGASEVGLAISASTFTTVVVFLPLIFAGGLVGILFKQLGSVIVITLLTSLAVAVTLSPLLASRLVKREDKKLKLRWLARLEEWMEEAVNFLNDSLQKILVLALNNRRKTIIIIGAVFLVSLGLFKFIGTEFFPQEDAGFIQAYVKAPVNTPLQETDLLAQKLTADAQQILGAQREVIIARSGQSPFGGGGFRQEGPNIIQFMVRLADKNKRKSDTELSAILRDDFKKIPGVWKVDFQTGEMTQQMSGGGGKPVSIEILGYDIDETNRVAEQLRKIMENTNGAVDVTVSREAGKMEYQLIIDRPKLAALGISPSLVANSLSIAFAGQTATIFREGKDEIDVFVRLRPEDRKELRDVLTLPVKLPDGRNFLMADLVQVKLAQSPLTIERKDQQRIVKVEANTYKRSLGEVASDIERQIKKMVIPSGVYIQMGGSVKDQRDAFRDLALIFMLGILLVYLVMAAQFESYRDPFVIMFSVPFAITGVLWGLFLTGQKLNVPSFIGLVMLVGVVVNNAIVYLDYVLMMRQKGMDLRRALLEAARVRLRPILMTTTTTLLGMLPMALSRGEGSESWRPLAVAVLGGLTISTLITLVIVPVMYSIFEERVRKF